MATARTGAAATAAAFLLLTTGGTMARAVAAEGGDAALEEFFGTYVGVAEIRDPGAAAAGGGDGAGAGGERDMDIVIEPYERDGFRIQWINVAKVGGRRDVPGVERSVQEVRFRPADGGADFYVEVPATSPFREREEMQPMRGDPVRWAAIEGDSLYVRSFVVLGDGRYELQIYERELTDEGLDLDFKRIVDGELVREIVGHTVRVGEGEGD